MDSFFADENDIIDAINEINNRDANNDWEYEIVDDTLLNLNWSYLGSRRRVQHRDVRRRVADCPR